jgi:YesN/AraC family two-component response regulator
VILAQNGRQALEIMSRQQPDLVLLDLLMPEMDGFGVLDAMRDRETTRDIPVIVLTAQTLSEEIVERLNKGVNGILTKGVFSVDETVAQIRAALCRENGHRATARQVAERAMVYLHEHYDESISRDDLAQYTGVSARYMTQCFRSELGLTPTDYLNRYRVEQAKRLLQEDVHSITDIALAVGYNSSAYFSRVFRSEVGMSPREFRDGARSANFAP